MFTAVKQQIRRETIGTVLDFYDQSIRHLSEAARREKYRKMSTSPFSFFRGSSHLFYYDFAKVPIAFDTVASQPTFIQGDLHFENFGVFEDGAGQIIYDVMISMRRISDHTCSICCGWPSRFTVRC